jgi:hypothetical protein
MTRSNPATTSWSKERRNGVGFRNGTYKPLASLIFFSLPLSLLFILLFQCLYLTQHTHVYKTEYQATKSWDSFFFVLCITDWCVTSPVLQFVLLLFLFIIVLSLLLLLRTIILWEICWKNSFIRTRRRWFFVPEFILIFFSSYYLPQELINDIINSIVFVLCLKSCT